MTTPLRTKIVAAATVVLAAMAGSAVAAGLAQTAESHQAPKTALVVAGAAASDTNGLAQARDAHVDLRVVRTNAEELGVTHMLAARGYDRVVVVGVDERTAVKPVRVKYPDTRFEAAASVTDALREID